ncbi:hypothetical protein D1BOALGB6SA_7036 [Olavius sp. associated proteobacterium Delta 1]|nr:hypothetical protein D1BOALGB6SA_7036 [Olavius sp. associated proteobacterium Delta 1]
MKGRYSRFNKHLTTVIAAIIILMISFVAFAAEEQTDYDPTLNPELVQPAFLNQIINVSNTGAAAFSVPIQVPPGRGGIAVPGLALQYASSGSNGWAGIGWDLRMGAIQRRTKYGLDYSGTDFVANGSTELVAQPDWGSNYYGARLEESFSRYQFISPEEGWVVTQKDGTRYYYGQTSNSRQENTRGVFKWLLDLIEDTNGNRLTVEYVKDQGQVYLARIGYTDDKNFVIFDLEDRTDIIYDYSIYSEVLTAKRLAGIRVYGNGEPARQYQLDYEYGSSTGRSRLIRINMPPLPPMEFSWQEGNNGAFNVTDYKSNTADFGNRGSNDIVYVDVNADARTDMVLRDDTHFYAYLAQADGSFASPVTTSGIYSCAIAGCIQTGDVNGDGRVDFISRDVYAHKYHTFLSAGDGSFVYAGPTDTDAGYLIEREMMADMNRDGKADLIKFASPGNPSVYIHFAKTDGSGLFEQTGVLSTFPYLVAKMTDLADVNGDGLPDIVRFVNGSETKLVVHLARDDGTFEFNGIETNNMIGVFPELFRRTLDANGDGLSDVISYSYTDTHKTAHVHLSNGDGSFQPPKASSAARRSPFQGAILYADINGDGRPDLVYRDFLSDSSMDEAGYLDVYFNNGDGTFAASATTTQWPQGYAGMGAIRFSDVNGDGLDDFISRIDDSIYSYMAAGNPPDLLAQKTDGTGAVSTLSYKPSCDYPNNFIPYVLQTVSTVQVNDGLGNVSTIGYDYVGGYYDRVEREYRGFNEVIQTNPNQTTVTSRYWVDDPFLKSKKLLVDTDDPSGNLLVRSYYNWETAALGPAVFVRLIMEFTSYYDSPDDYVGWRIDYTYDDTNGNLLSKTRAGSNTEDVTSAYAYNNYGDWLWRRTSHTLSGSSSGKVRETIYEYENSTGNLLYREHWLAGGTSPRISYTYDSYGNVTTVTDPKGNTTTTEYETVLHAHPSRIILPETNGVSHISRITAYDYRWGQPTSQTDENGHTTTVVYDGLGRPVQVDHPDGGQVVTEYYDSVVPRTVISRVKESASQSADTYQYFDGLGRPVQAVSFGEDGRPVVVRQYYDDMGRNYLNRGPFFAGAADYPQEPAGDHPYEQTTAYDYRSRPLRVESPLDPGVHSGNPSVAAATFGYDGYEVMVTDADGGQKAELGDYLGRIVRVREYLGAQSYDTLYDYNAAGDLRIVENKIGVQTQFVYDTLGRKISMVDPDLGGWSYTYDENGNLQTQTDAKNQVITFDYDALNRVTSKTYANGDPAVSYTYDNTGAGANGIGRLHAVSNAAATTTYDAYDAMGRQLSMTQSIAGAPQAAYTTSYGYDVAGKLLTMTYPDGYQILHTYFAGSGLLKTVTGPEPELDVYAELDSYRPAGQIGSIYFGNGTATAYGYDVKSSRLTSIATIDPVLSTLLDKSYTYSAAGNVKSMTNHNGVTYTYNYDSLHRLISETNNGPAESFAEVVIENTYNDGYRPLHAPSSVSFNEVGYPYGYDANANTTRMHNFNDPANVREQTISYNADNMPKQIEWSTFSGGSSMFWTVDFEYDGQSRRVKKATSWGNATFYVGNHFEVVNGTEVKYIFAGNQRVAKVTAEGTHFFHKDHLGSSNVVTNYSNGTAVETSEYMPFGQTRDQTGTIVSNYKFTDQELDPSTGLYNYDARLYDPVVGRFITADSIVQDLYDPQALNRYSYARNNPLKYVDPDGHAYKAVPIPEKYKGEPVVDIRIGKSFRLRIDLRFSLLSIAAGRIPGLSMPSGVTGPKSSSATKNSPKAPKKTPKKARDSGKNEPHVKADQRAHQNKLQKAEDALKEHQKNNRGTKGYGKIEKELQQKINNINREIEKSHHSQRTKKK